MNDYININVNLNYKNALKGLNKLNRAADKLNKNSSGSGSGSSNSGLSGLSKRLSKLKMPKLKMPSFNFKGFNRLSSVFKKFGKFRMPKFRMPNIFGKLFKGSRGLLKIFPRIGSGISKVLPSLGGFAGALGAAGAVLGVVTAGVVAFVGTFALMTAGFGALAAVLAKYNAELQVTNRVFNATFSEMPATANAAAKNLSNTLMLSKTETKKYLGDIADQFAGLGFSAQDGLSMAEGALSSAAKVARFRGMSMEESLAAVSKGMMGETDSLKRFGVVIKQNDKDFIKLKKSIMETTGATEKQATAQAVLQEIVRQSPNAFKSFKNVDWTVKIKYAQSLFKETFGELSVYFEGIYNDVADFAVQAAKDFKELLNNPEFQIFMDYMVETLKIALNVAKGIYNVFKGMVSIVGSIIKAASSFTSLFTGVNMTDEKRINNWEEQMRKKQQDWFNKQKEAKQLAMLEEENALKKLNALKEEDAKNSLSAVEKKKQLNKQLAVLNEKYAKASTNKARLGLYMQIRNVKKELKKIKVPKPKKPKKIELAKFKETFNNKGSSLTTSIQAGTLEARQMENTTYTINKSIANNTKNTSDNTDTLVSMIGKMLTGSTTKTTGIDAFA
jgi:hypothetical protein